MFLKNAIDGYKKAFTYRGAEGRKPYNFFILFQTIVFIFCIILIYFCIIPVANIADTGTLNKTPEISGPIALAIVGILIIVGISIYSGLATVAFSVRRLHDMGVSGWIFLAVYIAALIANKFLPALSSLINSVFLIMMMMAKTKFNDNKYRPHSTTAASSLIIEKIRK